MTKRSQLCLYALLLQIACFLMVASAAAQQTLGGITGVVTDSQGGILPGVAVTAVGDQTGLTRTQTSGSNGYYEFANLPIGTYTVTFTRDGFRTQKMP